MSVAHSRVCPALSEFSRRWLWAGRERPRPLVVQQLTLLAFYSCSACAFVPIWPLSCTAHVPLDRGQTRANSGCAQNRSFDRSNQSWATPGHNPARFGQTRLNVAKLGQTMANLEHLSAKICQVVV